MNFLRQKLSGLKKRLRSYRYGIVYLRDADFAIPPYLRINGRRKLITFNHATENGFVYEFTETCLNDAYRLGSLKNMLGTVNSIVDIGANQGLFMVAARQHFPDAAIAGYEPNKSLENVLGVNAAALAATVFYEAVTIADCRISLQFSGSDLNTIAMPAAEGNVTGTAFRKVVARAGGKIDILKIDCEGGEWAILDDVAAWQAVRSVTMEYHLWAKPGSTEKDILDAISKLGFRIIAHNPVDNRFGLLTAVKE